MSLASSGVPPICRIDHVELMPKATQQAMSEPLVSYQGLQKFICNMRSTLLYPQNYPRKQSTGNSIKMEFMSLHTADHCSHPASVTSCVSSVYHITLHIHIYHFMTVAVPVALPVALRIWPWYLRRNDVESSPHVTAASWFRWFLWFTLRHALHMRCTCAALAS